MKRRTVSVLIIAIGLGALAVLFLPPALQKRLILRACFHDAGGLRANAPVRVAGVDVGLVSSIHARPNQKDCPAEAEFVLSTRDELLIPNDALARIETAGVLGAPYVQIDVTRAVGPAIADHGAIKTDGLQGISAATLDASGMAKILNRLDEAIQKCGAAQVAVPQQPPLK